MQHKLLIKERIQGARQKPGYFPKWLRYLIMAYTGLSALMLCGQISIIHLSGKQVALFPALVVDGLKPISFPGNLEAFANFVKAGQTVFYATLVVLGLNALAAISGLVILLLLPSSGKKLEGTE